MVGTSNLGSWNSHWQKSVPEKSCTRLVDSLSIFRKGKKGALSENQSENPEPKEICAVKRLSQKSSFFSKDLKGVSNTGVSNNDGDGSSIKKEKTVSFYVSLNPIQSYCLVVSTQNKISVSCRSSSTCYAWKKDVGIRQSLTLPFLLIRASWVSLSMLHPIWSPKTAFGNGVFNQFWSIPLFMLIIWLWLTVRHGIAGPNRNRLFLPNLKMVDLSMANC